MENKSKQRVLVVIGTRPEAIKLAPVVKALRMQGSFEVAVCATGQHTDMMYPILDWFGLSRDFTLDVMTHKQPLAHLAGKLLGGLYDVIERFNPDIVVVQGDTTSAFVGALAGFYSCDHFWKNQLRTTPIRIAHVEAGLRTGDMYSPYPEEINRRLIAPLCHWNFVPTTQAAQALAREGVRQNVFVTGNTVVDALLDTMDLLGPDAAKKAIGITPGRKAILITSHRRENYGTGLQDICSAIKTLAQKYEGMDFIYPVHLNRHVREPVMTMLSGYANIKLIEPLNYPDFVALLSQCHLVLTDSGGIQEEAPTLKKPVLIMRESTERPEGVQAGTARLVGSNTARIVAETSALLDNTEAYANMAAKDNPFGDGFAAARIAQALTGRAVLNGVDFAYREAA